MEQRSPVPYQHREVGKSWLLVCSAKCIQRKPSLLVRRECLVEAIEAGPHLSQRLLETCIVHQIRFLETFRALVDSQFSQSGFEGHIRLSESPRFLFPFREETQVRSIIL